MKATTVKEVLVAARWIIDNIGWCQGTYYKDKDGKHISIPDDYTVGVCAMGSIFAVDVDQDTHLQNEALKVVQHQVDILDGSILPLWNDNPKRTKEQVLQLFDQAIEATK